MGNNLCSKDISESVDISRKESSGKYKTESKAGRLFRRAERISNQRFGKFITRPAQGDNFARPCHLIIK